MSDKPKEVQPPFWKRLKWWFTCTCWREFGHHDSFYFAGEACLWCGAKPDVR